MTTVVNQPAPGGAAWQADGLPRLLPTAPEDVRAHLARYGPAPYRNQPGALIADVEASGLTGRGGAAFPVHRKLAAVARAGVCQDRAVVVANGAESEPASRKDELLLQLAPNLVLDGLQLAAEAVGATEAHLYLHYAPGPQILRALAERAARGLDRLAVTITQAPPRFLAGQETAVLNRLGGGPALPTFQPPRVSARGLGGAPTLVQNVETLAHLALIARYGPRWFRAVGTEGEPGSMLTTVYRPDAKPEIHEVATGTPLRALLADGADIQAWLVGGYHGTWLPLPQAIELTLDRASLQTFSAAPGAGVLAALPSGRCGRVSERGLGGAPTLVQNVETLAHLALIARYGPRWFRAVGTAAEPGSMLTTIYRPDAKAHVREAAIGTPLRALLGGGDGDNAETRSVQAWLVGGYHGTWLPVPDAAGATLDNASLGRFGAAAGAGVLAALPSDRCGLTETARVVGYLAAESAGQCGPCLNGLPRIAAALAELAGAGHRRQTVADLERWSGLVQGRGACHHPDGTVRFVRSALTVFEPEIRRHARGQCIAASHRGTERRPYLPLPDGLPTREEDWT